MYFSMVYVPLAFTAVLFVLVVNPTAIKFYFSYPVEKRKVRVIDLASVPSQSVQLHQILP
jgi:hypothetical protein